MLQLVAEGKLALDDTVEQRLPGVIPNGKSITVRQLLNMTSGLFDYLNDGDSTVDDRLLSRRPDLSLVAAPADRDLERAQASVRARHPWSYCSTCYVLLGLIVEKATGHPLGGRAPTTGSSCRAGLRSTTFDTEPRIAGPHAHGYELLGKQLTDVSVLSPSLRLGRRRARLERPRPRTLLPRPPRRPAPPPGSAPRHGDRRPVRIGFGPRRYGLRPHQESLGCGIVFGHPGAIAGYEAYAYNSKDGRHQAVVLVSLGEFSQSRKSAPRRSSNCLRQRTAGAGDDCLARAQEDGAALSGPSGAAAWIEWILMLSASIPR